MKPTIGRIVHYVLAAYANMTPDTPVNEWIRAAIITKVHFDGTVNLQWFGSLGDAEGTESSHGKQFVSFSTQYKGGSWSWPPRE
jgi:hypothetical protein